jgi:hypothetical protein
MPGVIVSYLHMIRHQYVGTISSQVNKLFNDIARITVTTDGNSVQLKEGFDPGRGDVT